jgi:SH3-like domain-containing protein
MGSTSTPVPVYNRIDANRRNTWFLLPAFAVLLLPFAYGVTELLVPFSFYRTYVALGRVQAQLSLESIELVTCEPGTRVRLADAHTLLYQSAEASSAVLADLDPNVPVTVLDREAQFIRVRLVDGVAGYIPVSTGLVHAADDDTDTIGVGIHYRLEQPAAFHGRIAPGTEFGLSDRVTPLYRKPDGWSDVALELAAGTVVTFRELAGNFARVEVDRTDGYIPRAAGAARISPERSHL